MRRLIIFTSMLVLSICADAQTAAEKRSNLSDDVEAMSVIVLGQLVFNTFNGDPALGDTVCVTSDGSSEISLVVLGEIIIDVVETEDDILEVAIAVGDHHGNDTATEVGDTDFHSGLVCKGMEDGLGTVPLSDETFRIES